MCANGQLRFGTAKAQPPSSDNVDGQGAAESLQSLVPNTPSKTAGASWRANRVAYASGFSTTFVLSAQLSRAKVADVFEAKVTKESATDEQSNGEDVESTTSLGGCKLTFMLQNYRQVALDESPSGMSGHSRI